MPQTIKWVFDMDDTLAQFHKEKNALERFATEKDFFTNLKPTKMIKFLQMAIDQKRIDVNDFYIVSASPNESADTDKAKWLAQHLPMIPQQNILFTRIGQDKGKCFMATYKVKDLSKYCLFDDYTLNLIQWKQYNGKVFKYINDYNNTKQSYKQHNIVSVQVKDNSKCNELMFA